MQRILFALIGHKISIIPSLTVNLKVEKAHTHVFLAAANSHLLPYNDFYESLTANCRKSGFFGEKMFQKRRERKKRKKRKK